jgi:hypothetical protein
VSSDVVHALDAVKSTRCSNNICVLGLNGLQFVQCGQMSSDAKF